MEVLPAGLRVAGLCFATELIWLKQYEQLPEQTFPIPKATSSASSSASSPVAGCKLTIPPCPSPAAAGQGVGEGPIRRYDLAAWLGADFQISRISISAVQGSRAHFTRTGNFLTP